MMADTMRGSNSTQSNSAKPVTRRPYIQCDLAIPRGRAQFPVSDLSGWEKRVCGYVKQEGIWFLLGMGLWSETKCSW